MSNGSYLTFVALICSKFVAHDGFAARAQALAETPGFAPVVSDFVRTEFASVIARLTRMNSLHPDGARETFAEFDAWAAAHAALAEVAGIDIQTAKGFIRRLDLNVRAPDAINLAIAHRSPPSIEAWPPARRHWGSRFSRCEPEERGAPGSPSIWER